ncbi:drug resistance transporter, Bcr/CflA subfamily [Rhodomicrobium vannielii ATCC 17100]|uniref:Bcr/CflA family efflux transporter n=1 Tax=Rhodomicrobium vannielii (strain ATCC 17100 / DSM 162 / LMG 4299 / NCIMB 10020 / ATH 3.1.1) TaxID=648757 RepID=E3HZ65_RHOVT|nr:multidrug effflux MFS transporter [Rhodomicrobium vannielii]ADP72112.1 drug resistance transporter, Bcr/CflA subfamily [Rhodomicrobium vannielii ATCC 17100]
MLVKSDDAAQPQATRFPLSTPEFVTLIALLTALTALSIDIMLPALPKIASALGATTDNEQQLVLSVYFAGFAIGQFLFGPLSDSYGRRNPLLFGLALYTIGTVLAVTATSFAMLLFARAFQGFGAAAPRIVAIAVVRDRFAGREMARIMSFVTMVFVVVPILAPTLGEAIVQFSDWHIIFWVLLGMGLLATLWSGLRLPETFHQSDRLPFTARNIWAACAAVATTRQTAGYAVALGFSFGLLFSYIITSQQIFVDVYGLGAEFPIAFGLIAAFLAAASIINAKLVRRVGMRGVSHRAILGGLAVCGVMAAFGFPDKPPLWAFGTFMAAVFLCFGLMSANFNSLAMEPMGHIAGTASSLIGFYTTVAAAVLGTIVGQSFDGSVRPLCIGISVMFAATLATVLVTERGRLMKHCDAPEVKVKAA